MARTLLGVAAVAAAWGAGEAVDALTGVLPGPVAGLLVLALALLARPSLLEVVGPVADLLVRALPLLFVPAVVAVAAVEGDVHVGAAVVAVALSVPAGFVATALVVGRR